MTGRRRVGLWDRHNEVRAERREAMTPEQRKLAQEVEKAKKLRRVACAPVVGDPEAIDWRACDCGYQRPTRNGKPVTQAQDPAWQWTEEQGRSGKPCLRKAVKEMALRAYKIGYRHNTIELHNEGGFPDDMYWGPHGPKLIIRELKAMRPDWKPGQKQHLLSLQEVGQNVAVWFPCCLLSGLIDMEMAELAGVPPKGRGAQRLKGELNRELSWADVAGGALDPDD
jgi:hypothetical protein